MHQEKNWVARSDLRSLRHNIANGLGNCSCWLARRIDGSVGRRSDERLILGDQRLPGISVFQEGDQSGRYQNRAGPLLSAGGEERA